MPSSKKPAVSAASKPVAEKPLKAAVLPATKTGTAASKATAATKVKTVPTKSSSIAEPKKTAAAAVAAAPATAARKVGRPPKAAGAAPAAGGAKRGRKPKAAAEAPASDVDLSDIEDELVGDEPAATEEKVKPLRMKISKAKERALMKEFGLDETVLSEEDLAKRRSRLKTLITLGKTRGYLTQIGRASC